MPVKLPKEAESLRGFRKLRKRVLRKLGGPKKFQNPEESSLRS